jgi:hypothetical protein
MWLIVCAPIVSQLIAQAHPHEDAAVAEMAMSMGDMPMSHMHMAGMQMSSHHGNHHAAKPTIAAKATLAACGYCDLLATHAAMPGPAPAAELTHGLVVSAAAPVLSTRFTPIGAFPSGRPRAPPVVS